MYFLSNYDFSECICTVDDKRIKNKTKIDLNCTHV